MHFLSAHVVGLPNIAHRNQCACSAINPGHFGSGDYLRRDWRRDQGFAHQLPPLALVLVFGVFVWRLTVAPSFRVFSTRLGPVTTSVPGCNPVVTSMSDSPVIPVVTSTNFTLLF